MERGGADAALGAELGERDRLVCSGQRGDDAVVERIWRRRRRLAAVGDLEQRLDWLSSSPPFLVRWPPPARKRWPTRRLSTILPAFTSLGRVLIPSLLPRSGAGRTYRRGRPSTVSEVKKERWDRDPPFSHAFEAQSGAAQVIRVRLPAPGRPRPGWRGTT
jgi:hypothetical protein